MASIELVALQEVWDDRHGADSVEIPRKERHVTTEVEIPKPVCKPRNAADCRQPPEAGRGPPPTQEPSERGGPSQQLAFRLRSPAL